MIGIGLRQNRFGAAGAAEFSNTYSLDFDGVDDYVNCGNVTGLNGATEASWSCWLKDDDISLYQYPFAQYGTGAASERIIKPLIKIDIGRIDISFINLGFRVSGNPVVSAISTGQWFHFVITYNGGNTPNTTRTKAYIDGVELTGNVFGSSPTALGISPDDFWIGSSDISVTWYNFEGNIDEFSIWNTELSAADVLTLSAAPSDLTSALATSPIHWWRMGDGATFPTIPDEVGANPGTMTNMDIGDIVADVPT